MCSNIKSKELIFRYDTKHFSKKLIVSINKDDGEMFVTFIIFNDMDKYSKHFILLEEEFEEILEEYIRMKIEG